MNLNSGRQHWIQFRVVVGLLWVWNSLPMSSFYNPGSRAPVICIHDFVLCSLQSSLPQCIKFRAHEVFLQPLLVEKFQNEENSTECWTGSNRIIRNLRKTECGSSIHSAFIKYEGCPLLATETKLRCGFSLEYSLRLDDVTKQAILNHLLQTTKGLLPPTHTFTLPLSSCNPEGVP